jgi:hypothetical protein
MRGSTGGGRAAPSVFISWVHRDSGMSDAEAHAWHDEVRALAERLSFVGCVVEADFYELHADWSRYGPQKIDDCDFTLIILSEAYRKCWDGRNRIDQNSGATREINVLKGLFDRNREDYARRVIIILLPGVSETEIPDEIRGPLDRFVIDPRSGQGVEELMRRLTGQPQFVRPPIGVVRDLPPASNVTDGDNANVLWLDTVTWTQRNEVNHIIREVESFGPPPSRPVGQYGFDEWLALLSYWAEDSYSLAKGIDYVRSLSPADPPGRYVQTFDDCLVNYRAIARYLNNSNVAVMATDLFEAATRLHRLVKRLADLALEL